MEPGGSSPCSQKSATRPYGAPFGRWSFGRPVQWEDSCKIDLIGTGCMEVAQDYVQWRVLTPTVFNLLATLSESYLHYR